MSELVTKELKYHIQEQSKKALSRILKTTETAEALERKRRVEQEIIKALQTHGKSYSNQEIEDLSNLLANPDSTDVDVPTPPIFDFGKDAEELFYYLWAFNPNYNYAREETAHEMQHGLFYDEHKIDYSYRCMFIIDQTQHVKVRPYVYPKFPEDFDKHHKGQLIRAANAIVESQSPWDAKNT